MKRINFLKQQVLIVSNNKNSRIAKILLLGYISLLAFAGFSIKETNFANQLKKTVYMVDKIMVRTQNRARKKVQ
jgi:hypothetical protein